MTLKTALMIFLERRRSATASAFFIIASTVNILGALNATSSPDSIQLELDEITISAKSNRIASKGKDGEIRLSSAGLESMPAILGAPDAIRMMQTLPGVSSNSELTGGLFVQGSDNSQNIYTADGHRIVNPMHLLGLFPTLNNSYFSHFGYQPIPSGADAFNFTGARISAMSHRQMPRQVRGMLSIGLIESDAALFIPVRKYNGTIGIGVRTSYVDLLFGNALKLDESKLGYNFSDLNLSYTVPYRHDGYFAIDLFGSIDKTKLTNKDYASDNKMRWDNLTAGVTLAGKTTTQRLSAGVYDNAALFMEANKKIKIPSTYAFAAYNLEKQIKDLSLGAAVEFHTTTAEISSSSGKGFEAHIYTNYNWKVTGKMKIIPGLKLWGYKGKHESLQFRPLPCISMEYRPDYRHLLRLRYASMAQASMQIREATSGLPVDFWTLPQGSIKPMRTDAVSLTAEAHYFGIDLTVEGYFRHITHQPEFNGAILNHINPEYNPLNDVRDSSGNTWGFSVMAMKNVGRVKGWITYNFGRSRFHFSDDRSYSFPSSHDRTHDLKVNISWQISGRVNVGAAWTFATGYPYTRAAYGYMIGENLICEYLPHNSSRMPAYMRHDLSGKILITESRRTRQSIGVSFYNLLNRRNVIFISTSYSPEAGIQTKESTLRSVLPSLTYTLELK